MPTDGRDHRVLHFDTETGFATLLDLFEGRRQLIVQHFMFGPDWEQGCDGCSMMADHIGPLCHLHAKDTSFVLVSVRRCQAAGVPRRMGWKLPWVSSARSTFNEDFGATVDGEESTRSASSCATVIACSTPGRRSTAAKSRSWWCSTCSTSPRTGARRRGRTPGRLAAAAAV